MTQEELRQLLASLTLEEKVGQLVQLSGEFFTDDPALAVGPQQKLGIDSAMVAQCGSVLNVSGAARTRAIQEEYLKKSRHKIPLLFMCDVVYGFRTVFPIPLGFAASWDPDLVRACYEVAAREARAAGVHVTFAPMLDLIRDARWGRCLESTGEDPWLQSRYARAMVEGFQGSRAAGGSSDSTGSSFLGDAPHTDLAHAGIASCIKHFAGYGAVEAGREYNTVDMTERRLREMYLPPYRAAVEAGCKLVMPAFNTVDEVPATANAWLLGDVLRGEWGFDGTVITDYAAIQELVAHGVAADAADAAAQALAAGVDIDMKTACYANNLCDLVRTSRVDEELVDRACLRVLELKNDLGLFDDPYRDVSEAAEKSLFLHEDHRALARRLAGESLVLLKNGPLRSGGETVREGVETHDDMDLEHPSSSCSAQILPLDTAKTPHIALIGPYADTRALVGLWAVHANTDDVATLREAIVEVAGTDHVTCVPGCPFLEDDSALGLFGYAGGDARAVTLGEREAMRAEALDAARDADVVVMALGEHPMESGEGGSKVDVRLPRIQRELLRDIRALGKPVVAVVFSGRAPVLTDVAEACDALLEAWYPGTEGSHAIADVLFGGVNPTGRLAVTFPYATGQVPIYYNAFNTGRPERTSGHTNRFTSRYVDCLTDPLYPFGYGLSYHTCRYGEPRLSSQTLAASGSIAASIDVENVSDIAGDEVVQLYIRDVCGSVVRPVKELKGFARVHLEPGACETVHFVIDEPMLRFHRRDMTFGSEPGLFEVMVGRNADDVQTLSFELVG